MTDGPAEELERAYASRDWFRLTALSRTSLLGDPSRPDALLMLAVAAAEAHESDAARAGFARAAAALPQNFDAWANLGRTEAPNRPGPARHAFKRALALMPDAVSLFGLLALRWLDLGDPLGAARLLRRGHGFVPDAWDLCVNLGIALARAEEDSALGWLTAGVALAPNESAALTPLARQQLTQGDTESAETTMRRALAIQPSSPEAIRLEASLLRRTGRADEAEGRLIAIRRAEPSGSDIDLQIAAARLAQGRIEEAYPALVAACRHDPSNLPRAREILAADAAGELWLTIDGLKRRLEAD